MRNRDVPNKPITARVPKPVAASLKRIAADLEVLEVKTHDNFKMMGGDIVAALIAYADSLPPAEKVKILKSGAAEVKAMIEKAATLMEEGVREGKSDPDKSENTPGKIDSPMAAQ